MVAIWSLFGRFLVAFRSLAATFLLNFNHHDCTWLLSISAPIAIKNDGLSNGFTCPDKVILNDSRKASAAKIFYSLCFDPAKLRIFLAVLHKKEKASFAFARRHFCFFAPSYSPNLCKTLLMREATERFQVCPTCDTVVKNK